MMRCQMRALSYRDRAIEAAALADQAQLANVRDRHTAAAATWKDLAHLEEELFKRASVRIAGVSATLRRKRPSCMS